MTATPIDLDAAFAVAMDRLGPFEAEPSIAVAVSGGADSMALAMLARDWVLARQGQILALVVDHGLRRSSAAEAELTVERLGRAGIEARLLLLDGLTLGPALAERARIMRYAVLSRACRDAGVLHLLVGHHAADQTETLAMRVLRGSLDHGLACMAALSETVNVRMLRPLLGFEPIALRRHLAGLGVEWVEDPSNQDLRALRPRLRHQLAVPAIVSLEVARSVGSAGENRAREDLRVATELADRAVIRPEGFVLLSPGRMSPAALSRLIRMVSGAAYAPSIDRIARLAAQFEPATIAGVRFMPAGRSWMIVREEAALEASVALAPDVIWDNRFRLITNGDWPKGTQVGKLGLDASGFRDESDLPSAVLRSLPAIRVGKVLVAVPHLGYRRDVYDQLVTVLFSPRQPVSGAVFVPLGHAWRE